MASLRVAASPRISPRVGASPRLGSSSPVASPEQNASASKGSSPSASSTTEVPASAASVTRQIPANRVSSSAEAAAPAKSPRRTSNLWKPRRSREEGSNGEIRQRSFTEPAPPSTAEVARPKWKSRQSGAATTESPSADPSPVLSPGCALALSPGSGADSAEARLASSPDEKPASSPGKGWAARRPSTGQWGCRRSSTAGKAGADAGGRRMSSNSNCMPDGDSVTEAKRASRAWGRRRSSADSQDIPKQRSSIESMGSTRSSMDMSTAVRKSEGKKKFLTKPGEQSADAIVEFHINEKRADTLGRKTPLDRKSERATYKDEALSAAASGKEVEFWLERVALLSKIHHKPVSPSVIPEDCSPEQEHGIWQQVIDDLSTPTQHLVDGGQSIVEAKPPRGANLDEEAEYWRRKLEYLCTPTEQLLELAARDNHFANLAIGDIVEVVTAFKSDGEFASTLTEGMRGTVRTVRQVDEDRMAIIEFENRYKTELVAAKNFGKFRLISKALQMLAETSADGHLFKRLSIDEVTDPLKSPTSPLSSPDSANPRQETWGAKKKKSVKLISPNSA